MNSRTAVRVLITIVVLVVLFVVLSVTGVTKKFMPGTVAKSSSGWQAVFLNNGQVYFGHLKSQGDRQLVLDSIYYLQVDQSAQQTDKNAQPKLSLVKLGNELHGPKDQMTINYQNVLFTEDLKDDSKVVTAINDYVKNGSQPAVQPPAASSEQAPASSTAPLNP